MAQPTKPKSPKAPKGAKPQRTAFQSLLRNLVLAVSLLVIALIAVHFLLSVFTRHGQNKDVPNFVGSTLAEAEAEAKDGKLQIIVNASLYVPIYAGGVILEQRPTAGRGKVKSGRKIYVTINASHQRTVAVPYVAGYSLRQAKSNLLTAGLEIERLEYVEDIASNYVLSQKIGNETIPKDSVVMAPIGSKVTLVVGGNKYSTLEVPDLMGMTLREAKSTLWDLGLNLGRVEFEGVDDLAGQNSARVFVQYPEPTTEVSQGAKVGFRLRPEVQE